MFTFYKLGEMENQTIVARKDISRIINKIRNLFSIRLADSFSLFSIFGLAE